MKTIEFPQPLKLSEKEWDVLEYFIDKQGEEINKWRYPSYKDECPKSYLSYPEKIKSDFKINSISITKPTIGDACKKFADIGIFDANKEWPDHGPSKRVPGGGKIVFYSLKSDLHTIRVLVKIILELPQDDVIRLLSKPYFTHNINENLVRAVLEEKNVAIFRMLSIIEINDKLAQSIIDRFSKINEIESKKLSDIVRETLNRFEDHHKKDEESYISHLTSRFEQFFEDKKNNPSNLAKLYFLNDYLLYGLLEGKHGSSMFYKDILDFCYYTNYPVHMYFPVLNDQSNVLKKFKNANEYLFKEQSILEGASDEYFQDIINDLKKDYINYEFEKLVLPILVLISISPATLYDFLLESWKPFTLQIFKNHTNQPEILSRLLPITITDLMKNKKIPNSEIIKNVASRLYPPGKSAVSGDFFTDHGVFNNDRYHIWNERYWRTKSLAAIELPENATLRIRLKNLYELFFDIGFLFEADGSRDPVLNISLSIDVNQSVGPSLLSVEDLRDPINLIIKLQDRKNIVYNHIRSQISNKMQNALLCFDITRAPSLRFQQILVEELNKAMMGAEFYDETAFKCLKDVHPKVQEIMGRLKDDGFTKKEIILSYKNLPGDIDGNTLARNKYLLGKTFPDEISQEFVAQIEGWHEKYMGEYWLSRQ